HVHDVNADGFHIRNGHDLIGDTGVRALHRDQLDVPANSGAAVAVAGKGSHGARDRGAMSVSVHGVRHKVAGFSGCKTFEVVAVDVIGKTVPVVVHSRQT